MLYYNMLYNIIYVMYYNMLYISCTCFRYKFTFVAILHLLIISCQDIYS